MSKLTNESPPIEGFDPRAIYGDGIYIESADLFVGVNPDAVVGRVAACAFIAFRKTSGEPLFQGVTVVAPPVSSGLWDKSDDEILALVKEGIEALMGVEPTAPESESIRQRVIISRCESLNAAELVQEMQKHDQRLIIVPHADVYRHADAVEPHYEGKASARVSADHWVPHVVTWADQYLQTIKDTGNYLLLITGQSSIIGQRHQDDLAAVEGLFPAYFTQSRRVDLDAVVTDSIPKWVAMAVANRADEALREIEDLDIDDPGFKHQLKIQMLARTSRHEETLVALRSYVESGLDIPGEMAARFGRVAARVGDRELALELIKRGLDSVVDRTLLEVLLIEADKFGDDGLELRVYHRLKALFPDSLSLVSYREHLLLRVSLSPKDHAALASLSRIELSDFESEILRVLTAEPVQDLDTFISSVGTESQKNRDLASLCCATYASKWLTPWDAIKSAIRVSNPGPLDERACWLVIGSIKQILLHKNPQERVNDLEEPLSYVRRFIAKHPAQPHIREAFADLFSVDSSANLGLPLVIAQALKLVQKTHPLELGDSPVPLATVEELDEFLARADAWLVDKGFLDVSHTPMPLEVISGVAEELLNSLAVRVERMANTADLDLLEEAEHLSFIACALARHVPDTEADINALRTVSCCFAGAGQTQRARDRAEQILELAGPSESRQRAAWIAFSDIYQRSNNAVVALVGIALAFELPQRLTPEQLWWEIYVLFRTVRDAGMYPVALSLLENLRELAPLLSEPKRNLERIKTMELNLRVMYRKPYDREALIQLVSEAEEHCRSMLKDNLQTEALPAIAALAQSISLLEHYGGTPSAEASLLLTEALEGLDPQRSSYISALTSSKPSITETLLLNKNAASTRNADDIPRDLKAAELAARRLLREANGSIPVDIAAAAIEMLADHGLDSLEGARDLDSEWPLEYAQQIVPDDGAVLMLALDTDGILASLTVDQNGTALARQEALDTPFKEALQLWSKQYPQKYGYIDRDDGNNEFYLTMADLPVPLPDCRRLVVVAEPALQQVPMSLALINEEFAGRSCAIGYVPSLTWLEAVQRRPRLADSRRVTWISDATGQGKEVLGQILARTEESLEEHGFEIDRSHSLPASLKGAKMAVVAAHGDVSSDGKYFHRVSDEGTLIISPAKLARALEGTELAIVFICNGGRTDRHPLDNTAVGLPKHLLSAGCRTVIASPWPLAAILTGPWLRSFLQSWDAGLSALDATFEANQAVDQAYGSVPQYSWAMTVYGDVSLKKE